MGKNPGETFKLKPLSDTFLCSFHFRLALIYFIYDAPHILSLPSRRLYFSIPKNVYMP